MRKTILLSTFLLALLVPAAQAGSPVRATVVVKDYAFSPSTVVIKKGGTVTWAWRGRIVHNVYPFSNTLRTSGSLPKKFTQAKTYSYHCTIHPGMTGKVVVRNS